MSETPWTPEIEAVKAQLLRALEEARKQDYSQLVSEIENRQHYVKHGPLHDVNERDPLDVLQILKHQGGAWPFMSTPTSLTVASNAITVSLDYHYIKATGNPTIKTINGGVVNKLVMFQFDWTTSGVITWRDYDVSGGNIKVLTSRYKPLLSTTAGGKTFEMVWKAAVPPDHLGAPTALGWLTDQGYWTLIDLTMMPMRFYTENMLTGATSVDAGGTNPILMPADEDGIGVLSLHAPNASTMTYTLSAGTLDRIEGQNFWRISPETGASDDWTSITPIANSFSNNVSGRMYNGDWFIATIDEPGNVITIKSDSGSPGSSIFTEGDVDIVLSELSQAVLFVGDPSLGTGVGGFRAFAFGTNPGTTAGFWPVMNPATTLTIAGGAITVTQDHHIVNGQGGLDDTLDTINGFIDNKWLVLRAPNQEITFSDAGNIQYPTSDGFVLKNSDQYALLWYNPDEASWIAFAPEILSSITDPQTGNYRVEVVEGYIYLVGALNATFNQYVAAAGKITSVNSGLAELAPETGTSDDVISIQPFDDATIIFAYVGSGNTITLKNNDAGGTSGYKIFCQGGTDIVMDGSDSVLLVYNATLDTGAGGWMAGLIGGMPGAITAEHHTVAAQVDVTVASTTVPYQVVGPMAFAGTITGVEAAAGENKTNGATSSIFDVHKILAANVNTDGQGTTIFTTSGNRPTISNGNKKSTTTMPDVTTFAAGDYLVFYTDQSGSTLTVATVGVRYTNP